MDIVLAQPRGFCAGVVRAIEIVELALEIYRPPVYVFHEIVHNPHVVSDLKTKGAIFVEDLADVPVGAVTIFSAHGVATSIVEQAQQKSLEIIDATCPLVTKVHLQAQKYSQSGHEIVIIGHLGHEEVEGTMGSVPGPVYVVATPEDVANMQVQKADNLAFVTQTTLSVDDTRDVIEALRQRFPNIQGPSTDDICYATQNRQNAVRELSRQVELLLVVGARNSSNSNRLKEVGEQCGVASFLIQDAAEIRSEWLEKIKTVGITAGASTPEVLVNQVIDALREYGVELVMPMNGIEETTTFRLPKSLMQKQMQYQAKA